MILPLIAAAYLLIDRWGKENLAFYLAIPFVLIVLRMFVSSLELPRNQHTVDHSIYNRAVARWHVCDVTSFFFLMLFEIAVAIAAEVAIVNIIAFVLIVLCAFVPYLLLSYWAHVQRKIIHQILAASSRL